VLQSSEKGILNEIFRVLAMPQKAHRQRHRALEITLDELAERITVAIPNARKKFALVIGLIGRAKHERCT
jgi:hypothetical protein